MLCLSITYKMTPVEIRQKFAFSKEEILDYISEINMPTVIVSTCNRVEIYVSGDMASLNKVQDLWCKHKNIDKELLLKHVNVFVGNGAIKHLYNVACGMESMILGEDEILGQVKDGYYLSHNNFELDYELNHIFLGAITCAKKIKTDTLISKTAVSVGTLVANMVFDFNAENVLIMGATGVIGNIVLKNISANENINIYGTRRVHNALTNSNNDRVKWVDFNNRYDYIDMADVVISATASPYYTVTKGQLKNLSNKERLFIDLAVPFDIDKGIGEIENTKVFDIDYFEEAAKENNTIKLREADRAKVIIEHMVDDTKKNLFFHSIMGKMDSLKENCEKHSFEQLFYNLRDGLNTEEFTKVVKIMENMGCN